MFEEPEASAIILVRSIGLKKNFFFFFLVKKAGRHFGFFKRAGRHEKGAGRRALQKKPRQNTGCDGKYIDTG